MSLAFESDFFLQFRPFPEVPSNPFEKHWHEIVGSAAFYQLINISAPWINSLIFGKHYTSITSKKLKTNFDIHVVSSVQCIISILLCIPMFSHRFITENPVFGQTDFGGFVASVTIGYFIWDLYVCLKYFQLFGAGFLVHAVSALYVFLTTLIPYMQPYVPVFLIFELSSPFVNINWYASRLPTGTIPEKVVVINGILLMVSFFLVRVVWGFYAAIKAFFICWEVRDQLPAFYIPTVYSLNITLDFLNLYWFTKMVQIAVKKAKGTSNPKKLE